MKVGSTRGDCRQEKAVAEDRHTFQPHERCTTRTKENTVASAYHQLLQAALKNLTTLDGQLQFLTTQTGVSDECLRRVLVHVNAQPVFDEEGDLKTRTRNEGVSIDEYAVGRGPLLEMSIEQAQARLREIEREDPALSEEALEKVRAWEAIVGTIARLSGEGRELVITILSAVSTLSNRQDEIVHELMRLKASGESASDLLDTCRVEHSGTETDVIVRKYG